MLPYLQAENKMAIDQSWAVVTAALGASVLTNLGSFVVLQWQRRYDAQAASTKEKQAAYGELHARVEPFARRAGSLALAKQSRSGLMEGVDILLGHRVPVDIFKLYEWIDADYCPLSEACSKIHLIGSQEAIIAADSLLVACGELMDVAIATDSQRNDLVRLLRGERQSPQQAEAHQKAMQRLFKEREVFAAVVRKETGKAPVEFPIQRAGKLGNLNGGRVRAGVVSPLNEL